MRRNTLIFAYGTLQHGFANHARLEGALGAPLGRFRTVERFPLAVTTSPGCTNPGCRYVHHMCALLPDAGDGFPVEGDVYDVRPPVLVRLDELEGHIPGDEARSTYLRRGVRLCATDGSRVLDAQTYFVAAAERWRALVADGRAELRRRYTRDLADGPLKPCCRRDPAHAGPHDVIEPPGG